LSHIIFDCQEANVDIYVSNENYTVDFLENKKKHNAYNGVYIGSLSL